MTQRIYLGDGVYARLVDGMIELTGNAGDRDNVIYLEPAVYEELRRFAQSMGLEIRPEHVR